MQIVTLEDLINFCYCESLKSYLNMTYIHSDYTFSAQ
jgi:hypothetical protein